MEYQEETKASKTEITKPSGLGCQGNTCELFKFDRLLAHQNFAHVNKVVYVENAIKNIHSIFYYIKMIFALLYVIFFKRKK